LAFLLSASLHLVVLGWFGLKRAVTEWRAEAPAVNVQLVRLPPPAPLKARTSPKLAAGRASTVVPHRAAAPPLASSEGAIAGTPAPPGIPIDPRWRVDRNGPNPPPRREPDYDEFQPCDPLKDPKRQSKACRKVDEIADSVTRFYDPQKGKTAAAREARRNEALKRYRDAPGAAGYPGIGCAVLHRC
jgi:hypothetical protein